jgi:hypothetical protein
MPNHQQREDALSLQPMEITVVTKAIRFRCHPAQMWGESPYSIGVLAKSEPFCL